MSRSGRITQLPPMPVPPLNEETLPAFVLKPVVFGTQLQCSIVRKKSVFGVSFELYLDSDAFALSARKTRTADYHMFTSIAETSKEDPKYAGKVEKDTNANIFVVFGRGENYKKSKLTVSAASSSEDESEDPKSVVTMAMVGAKQNVSVGLNAAEFDIDFDPFLGNDELSPAQLALAQERALNAQAQAAALAGPGAGEAEKDHSPFREELATITVPEILPASIFRLLIPPVTQAGIRREIHPAQAEESLLSMRLHAPERLIHLISRKPMPNPKTGRLQMDFHGRAKVASIKNQQLILGDVSERSAVESPTILLFGKVDDSRFALDISWPLCPLQAFAIALVIFDTR